MLDSANSDSSIVSAGELTGDGASTERPAIVAEQRCPLLVRLTANETTARRKDHSLLTEPENLYCSLDQSHAADNITAVEHYASQTCNTSATDKEHLLSSNSATALDEFSTYPNVRDADNCNTSSTDINNTFSTEEHFPLLIMCASGVESNRSHRLVSKSWDINTTTDRANICEDAEMTAQFQSVVCITRTVQLFHS